MITAEQFDSDWYLNTYPDVAAAGVNPWIHYINHGRFEGRRPFQNRVIAWEYHLWRGGDRILLPRLEHFLLETNAIEQERQYAIWTIARWYAVHNEWLKVLNSLQLLLTSHHFYPSHAGPYLLLFEAALQCNRCHTAKKTFEILSRRFGSQIDVSLAEINLLSSRIINGFGDRNLDESRLTILNRIFLQHGLYTLDAKSNATLNLDSLYLKKSLPVTKDCEGIKVSVIVPVYNAERTLITALRSLCEQTWRNLEILIIDDASEDNTWQLIQNYIINTSLQPGIAIRLLRHNKNLGTYAARNTGLSVAEGDLITTHDSDDWSHPQKIEYQANALLSNPDKVACTSHWVRTTENFLFSHWRLEDSWVYRNISSLMFRRSVFNALGYWDRVSVNSDTEYYLRIIKYFGGDALTEILPGVPLSFGRIHKDSLTLYDETHLITRYYGVRKDYEDAARRWHSEIKSLNDLYLPEIPKVRPFQAPFAICTTRKNENISNPMDLVQQSGYFDPAWYLEQYSDLQDATVDLFEHYWKVGSMEGKDPGPLFSTSYYEYRFPQARAENLPVLHHFLTVGCVQGLKPLDVLPGNQLQRTGALNLLICAHQAGKHLYGAERSLLDVLKVLNELGVNLFVVLPSAINAEYIKSIRSKVVALTVIPYGWWKAGRIINSLTLEMFKCLIKRFDIRAVYANTLVLDEPLIAARLLNILNIVHVRELPFADEALCRILGASPELITERVRKLADIVLVNSLAAEREIASSNTVVVPNIVDVSKFESIHYPIAPENKLITIALISSNLPKKGLADFVELADILEQREVPVICKLIGPETEYIKSLQIKKRNGEVSKYLEFNNYTACPWQALTNVDIVVNLSNFQESFGRTVLEAMAAGLPVVAYHWGALPELIVNGKTGFLVPFKNLNSVADRIIELVQSKDLRLNFGKAGRIHARKYFSEAVLRDRLNTVLSMVVDQTFLPQ
ncbi:glycosyltransferase [Microbulbifer sp. DLAB2-AF]|uniref:glycosyltransferase n=1 Tax=Microbulbifer sp. DLAB2-AF TaxID=3243395 RepID=UPI004039DA54